MGILKVPEQTPRKNAQGRKTSNFKLDGHGSTRRDSAGIAGQALLQNLIDSGLSKDADSIHLYINSPDQKDISCYFHQSSGLVKSEKKFSPTILVELVEYLKKVANLEVNHFKSVQSAQFSLPHLTGQKFRLISIKNSSLGSEHLILHFEGKKLEVAKLSDTGLRPDNLALYNQVLKSKKGIIIVGSNDIFSAQNFIISTLKSICTKTTTVLEFDSSATSSSRIGNCYDRVYAPVDHQNLPIIKSTLSAEPEIIAFMDPANSSTVDLATEQASLGRLVFIIVNQPSAGLALKNALALSSDPKATLQAVTATTSLTTIKSIRRSSVNHNLTDQLLDQLETFFGVDGKSGWVDLFGHAKLTLSEPVLPIATEYGPLTSLIEILNVNEELKTALAKNSSTESDVITWLAIRSGMLTRRHDGLVRALQGELDIADVVSVTS